MRQASPGRGWAAWRLLREVVLRLHHGYEATPEAARRAWWRILLVGALLVQLLSLGLVSVARSLVDAGALDWEPAFVHWLDRSAPVSFNTAMWLEGLANGFVLWFVVLFAAGVAAWRGRAMLSLSFLVGYTAVYLPMITGWLAWDRARPTIIAGGIGSPGGFFRSFPSGHMVQSVFAYGLLLSLWYAAAPRRAERALVVAVWVLLVLLAGASRLRLGAHWPSDIVGGFLLACAWLAVVLLARRVAAARS